MPCLWNTICTDWLKVKLLVYKVITFVKLSWYSIKHTDSILKPLRLISCIRVQETGHVFGFTALTWTQCWDSDTMSMIRSTIYYVHLFTFFLQIYINAQVELIWVIKLLMKKWWKVTKINEKDQNTDFFSSTLWR